MSAYIICVYLDMPKVKLFGRRSTVLIATKNCGISSSRPVNNWLPNSTMSEGSSPFKTKSTQHL